MKVQEPNIKGLTSFGRKNIVESKKGKKKEKQNNNP